MMCVWMCYWRSGGQHEVWCRAHDNFIVREGTSGTRWQVGGIDLPGDVEKFDPCELRIGSVECGVQKASG